MITNQHEKIKEILHKISIQNKKSLPSGKLKCVMSSLQNSKKGKIKDVFVRKYFFTSILLFTKS